MRMMRTENILTMKMPLAILFVLSSSLKLLGHLIGKSNLLLRGYAILQENNFDPLD